MSFRFLHIADLHLGASFSQYPEAANALREAQKSSFAAAIDAAVSNRVHAFLIAGDLLNGEPLSRDVSDFLSTQLNRLHSAGISVFYARGNHDPASLPVRLPSFVEIFDNRFARMVEVRDMDGKVIGAVIGAGYSRSQEYDSMLPSFPRRYGHIPTVGLLHTQLYEEAGKATPYAPVSLSALEACEYDYWALGHIHRRQSYGPHIAYSGCLCGTGFDDVGPHGGLLVELEAHSIPSVTFLPLAQVEWREKNVSGLASCVNEDMLFNAIHNAAEALRLSAPGMLRFCLRGEIGCYEHMTSAAGSQTLRRLSERLSNNFPAFYTEIEARDLSAPISPDAYIKEFTLLSEMLRTLSAAEQDDTVLNRILESSDSLGLAGCMRGTLQERQAYARSFLRELEPRVIQIMKKEGSEQ